MGVVGVTLIVGAVVFFVLRPPHAFLGYFQSLWRGAFFPPQLGDGDERARRQGSAAPGDGPEGAAGAADQKDAARSTPPPPPAITVPSPDSAGDADDGDEEQTTPKADKAAPSFALSAPDGHDDFPLVTPPPPPTFSIAVPKAPAPAPSLMAPPPRPGSMAPPPRPASSGAASLTTGPPRLPPLSQQQSPYAQSQLSRSTLPIPNRGPSSSSSSSLAPPPTHTNKPLQKSPAATARSRLVPLAPGHSPLDWARISSGPAADLRNLPPGTPYLRVSPSMLKRRDGRKGRDAWSVYGSRVYNVTPYVPFHPGGKGELLRGAGKDATRLFGEVHPWVNYETMLAACLVGIAVEEGEGDEDDKVAAAAQNKGSAAPSVGSSNMEEMD